MDIVSKLAQIERIDRLIRRRATGTPKDLSVKLGVSERHIFNIINMMKNMGAPIEFCCQSQSYYYLKNVMFSFGFILEEDLNKSRGGYKNNTFAYNDYTFSLPELLFVYTGS